MLFFEQSCWYLKYFFFTNCDFNSGKEARKKELKKNKKQRQMVRAAVLKGKDPVQLIAEMEKIDQMGKFTL